MIVKEISISLTDEEVHSPEPIQLKLKLKMADEGIVDYTITIPKGVSNE
jgi:hypothetical protein